MLLKQLEYFAAVVDCQSFTKAAKRCYVSQSAISQQVKALEEELGTRLIDREGRRIALTQAGEEALSCAREVLARTDRMRLEIERMSDARQHELRVGYLSRYEGWEVRGAIAAYTVRHPQVRVSAVSGSHDDLYQMMLSGRIDMAFNDRRRELSEEFANEYLMTRTTVIEISEANGLASLEQATVSQLADTPCILIAHEDQRDRERAYYQDTLNFPSPFLFAETLEEAHMMVAGNRGFLPLEVRGDASPAGSVIKRIPLVNAAGPLKRDYYAFWPKGRTGWVVKEFARILKGLLNPA